MSERPLIFSTPSYEAMQEQLIDELGWRAGVVLRESFPDGERYRRIESDCAGRDVLIVGGSVSDAETLELYDLASAAADYGANRLALVMPYFGYSTMERATQRGEVVTAKNRARMLSSIPAPAMGTQVFLVDLHVDGIAHYFEGNIRPVHLYAKPIIAAAARELGGNDFVLACTDAGRAKWVESMALDLGVDMAFVYKRRVSGSETEVAGVSAHVKGRNVIIYDDMIRTGSSLLGAAQAYRDAGATTVHAITTHGVFPGQAAAKLEDSGLLESIICTDTHPNALRSSSDFLKVYSIAPHLADCLRPWARNSVE